MNKYTGAFEIYFDDLSEDAKSRFRQFLESVGINLEDSNLDTFPLAEFQQTGGMGEED